MSPERQAFGFGLAEPQADPSRVCVFFALVVYASTHAGSGFQLPFTPEELASIATFSTDVPLMTLA